MVLKIHHRYSPCCCFPGHGNWPDLCTLLT